MILLMIYIGIVSVLILTSFYRPHYSISAAFFMFGLDQLGIASHSIFLRYTYLTNVIVGVIISIAYIRLFTKKYLLIDQRRVILILSVALIVWSMMSIIWSSQASFAYNKWMMQIPYWVVLVVLLPRIIRSEAGLYESLKLVVLISIPFLIAFLFFIQWSFRSFEINGSVQGETLGLPLALSELGGYLFIISVLFVTEKSLFWKCLRLVVALMSCILIIKTGSRGQFFLAIIAVLVMLPFVKKGFSPKIIISIATVGLLIAFGATMLFDSFSEGGAERWESNVLQGVYSARLDGAFKLVGKAFSSLSTLSFGLGNSAAFDVRLLGFYPHIVPLEILAEEGLLGFVLFVSVFTQVFILFRMLLKTCDTESSRVLTAIVAGLVIFQFGLSFKQGSLLGSQWLFAFPIMLERLYSAIVTRKRKRK